MELIPITSLCPNCSEPVELHESLEFFLGNMTESTAPLRVKSRKLSPSFTKTCENCSVTTTYILDLSQETDVVYNPLSE